MLCFEFNKKKQTINLSVFAYYFLKNHRFSPHNVFYGARSSESWFVEFKSVKNIKLDHFGQTSDLRIIENC